MKMELTEGSETSAIRTQTPGNYPKENILQGRTLFDRSRPTVGCCANGRRRRRRKRKEEEEEVLDCLPLKQAKND